MSLLEKCKEFEKLMSKYSNFGAYDTELRFHFRNALYCKINKDIEKIPQNSMDWELYSSMEGSKLVAEELTEELTIIINLINSTTYGEIKDLISWYDLQY